MIKTNYTFKRHDLSTDKSLKAFSAADEYLVRYFSELDFKPSQLSIYNDRFGYLSCYLQNENPLVVLTQKSQEKAINSNLKSNKLEEISLVSVLDELPTKTDLAFIKMPKSLDLFQLFLHKIHQNSIDNVQVVISFMTRHFTPKMLEIANQYFQVVEQSRAVKKARLLILKSKKETEKINLIHNLAYNGYNYQQYLGVFSAKHIDYATQYFLKHIEIKENDEVILDLASGNGVIANEIYRKYSEKGYHLIDDSLLAVASAKLNLNKENIHHHCQNDLSSFKKEKFDVIVTNPPFHFEYEINIQVPINLFKECHRCLKTGGNLQIVANKHLNYKTHLIPIFSSVEEVAINNKFVVYKCVK